MQRSGGSALKPRRWNRLQLLFGLPVALGAAVFLSAPSSDPDARSVPIQSAAATSEAPSTQPQGTAIGETAATATPATPGAPGVPGAPASGQEPQAPTPTPAAVPAPAPEAAAPPAKPDTTLPANPALRSLEARVEWSRKQAAAALAQLAAQNGLSGVPAETSSGHAGGTNPELLPDLRPLATETPDDVPGSPFFTPDPTNPVWDNFVGPFRADLPGRDQSNDPSPMYTEEERKQLVEEGRELFFSTTAWGQRPSKGLHTSGEFLSCASCHSGEGFTDNRTHIVGPVREREFGHRQTPALFGIEHTAPFMWDGRNATLQNQARGAITAPLEMNSAREPTKRELDALREFQIQEIKNGPKAVPGRDFDPVRAARGEKLFRTPRDNIDPAGEFAPGEKISCATCHSGQFFTDGKAHRGALPTIFAGDLLIDPGRVGEDGNIEGFDTPSLLGVRFSAPFFHDGIAGDPTAPSNLMGGGLGVGVLDGDVGAVGPAAARRALLNNVLPFYNSVRFNFGFTQSELEDLAEFLLSL